MREKVRSQNTPPPKTHRPVGSVIKEG
jgi:hypothetical protein